MGPKSLKHVAYDTIKDKIVRFEIEPNSRIMEDVLAQEIGISRTPVREAINQLAAEGYIRSVPRRGIYCADFSPQSIRDVIDIRLALEKLVVAKCIEHGLSDEQKQRLGAICDAFERAKDSEDSEECVRLDGDFHRALSEICGNQRLTAHLREIEVCVSMARNLEILRGKTGRKKHEQTLEDHRDILATLVDGDIARAERAIVRHIGHMRENLGLETPDSSSDDTE